MKDYQPKVRYDQPIFAPFNFVPINEEVFSPPHADRISQDIPFSDQVSGSLSVTLTAESPVFTKDSSSDQLDGSFCCLHDGGSDTYFLPATSVKGCVRSVLEAMSFGKMTEVSDKKFETKDFKYNDRLTIHTVMPKLLLNPKGGKGFKPDLAECLFGYTFDGDSLRGRVQFGHAMAEKGTAKVDPCLKSFEAYTPHPSYYPIYSLGGVKWDEPGAIVTGRKRYLIQDVSPEKAKEDASKVVLDPRKKKDAATAKMHFLEKGVRFSLTVRFHNLRPFELGALLSALTFHGNNDACMHNMGFGKPYGYGRMRVSDPVLNLRTYDGAAPNPNKDWRGYLADFEKVMTGFKTDWRRSPQVVELIAIAGGWDRYEGYMTMKQYGNAKRNRKDKSLKRFSQLYPDCFRMPPAGTAAKSAPKPASGTKEQPVSASRLEVGKEVTAKCIGERMIRIDGCCFDTPLFGLKKSQDPMSLVGKRVKVRVNQLTRAGVVTQATFIALL